MKRRIYDVGLLREKSTGHLYELLMPDYTEDAYHEQLKRVDSEGRYLDNITLVVDFYRMWELFEEVQNTANPINIKR